MDTTRRSLLAMSAALPIALKAAPASAQAGPAVDVAALWRSLFAGPADALACWWSSGTLYAHVDRLREFPVAGLRSIMILRTAAQGSGATADFRTIGLFTDLDTGKPADRWYNVFTDRMQDLPPFFVEGPGRYGMTPGTDGPALTLTSAHARTNRILATGEASGNRLILTQLEGTLQGFPGLDGALPPLDGPAVTERQTRIQIIARSGAPNAMGVRGFFSHVYDALPPWLGFGDTLGSGLSKGQMRKAGPADQVDAQVWAYLKSRLPDAFAGDRLVLR
jgi:hypothetical protein